MPNKAQSSSDGAVMTGVQHTDVVDFITHEAKCDAVTLVMVEERSCGSEPDMLLQLRDKVNVYLSYALDGQMAKEYPRMVVKPLRLQLDCKAGDPGDETRTWVAAVDKQLAETYGIRFQIRLVPASP